MEFKQSRKDVRIHDMVRLRVIQIDGQSKETVLDRIAVERLSAGFDDYLSQAARKTREMREHTELPSASMMNLLYTIDSKIDAVLMYLMQKDVEDKWGDSIPVNLSAGGIWFPWDRDFAAGQLLRLEIMLQTYPPHPIIALAEVIRAEEQPADADGNKPFNIAAKFISLDPNDQDQIIKRVFQVQRMLLRRTRESLDNQMEDLK